MTSVVSCIKSETTIIRYKCDAGYIEYKATIGFDFDSALDSLLRMETIYIEEPYVVKPECIGVDYLSDDRSFFWISVKDTEDDMHIVSPIDVLDTKGCWHLIEWAED